MDAKVVDAQEFEGGTHKCSCNAYSFFVVGVNMLCYRRDENRDKQCEKSMQ